MATRFYLPISGTSPLGSLAIASAWEHSAGTFFRAPTWTSKSNTALTDKAGTFPDATTDQMCWAQWVSHPLRTEFVFTTSHTISMVVRGVEADLSCDAHLAYTVRVVSGDGSTVRATIAQYHATSTELTASVLTRIHNARVLNSGVTAQVGDRIVIELGSHGVTPATTYAITWRFGDPSATSDFALTAGLTTDLCPWVELSPTLDLGHTLAAASTLTAFTAAAASLSHTPPTATTLTAGSTLTAFTAGSASLASVVPTTLTAASTLTAFTAGTAALAWSPATPTTLTAASTLTGFTAGSASIAWSPATPTTLTAASTLTGMVSSGGVSGTFGNDSLTGATAADPGSNSVYGTKHTLGTERVFTSMSVYVSGTGSNGGDMLMRGVVYDDDGAGGAPGTLKGYTEATTILDAQGVGWVTMNFTSPSSSLTLPTGSWWLCAHMGEANGAAQLYRDLSTGTGWYDNYGDTFTDGPANPCVLTGQVYPTTRNYCVYATYSVPGASISHTPPPATTLTAASAITGLLSGAATMGNTAPTPKTLTAASTLTGLTSAAAAIAHTPPAARTLTAASTLTGFAAGAAAVSHYQYTTGLTASATLTGLLSAAATLGNAAPPATTMTAASTFHMEVEAEGTYLSHTPPAARTLTATSTLTGLPAAAAAISWTAPPARTLTAASTLTGFTAGNATLAHGGTAAPTTLTADSTLTGMTAGSASITWTGPPATTLTGSSTLTGYVSASADLANTAPAAVTMTAASTLTAVVSASADLTAALPVLMTAASTLTGKVSGVSYLMLGVSEPIRWNAPRPWPNSSTERGRQRQPVPAAPAKWRWDHER